MSRLGGIDSQYFDADGLPLQSGELYFYETGTSTPKSTYNDETEQFPNSWPIVFDAAGVPPPIFFTGTAKIALQDEDGNILRTLDPVEADSYEEGDPILYRLGSIDSQFFDDNGDPLSNGSLHIYENGSSTPKATYSDNALSVENDWPVVLDSVGFLGDVFYQGKAKLVLTDEHDVQQRELDEVETFDFDNLEDGFPPGYPSCVWTPPDPEEDIIAELIWVDDEVYDYINQGYVDGLLGVKNDEIIWRGNGKRIFHSSDGGDTVTETGTFPGATSNPMNLQWTFYSGTWYARVRDSDQPSAASYIASTDDGTSWVSGDPLWQGRYAGAASVMDATGLVSGGRPATPNDLTIARYPSLLGSGSEPALWTSAQSNRNAGWMQPLGDNYWLGYVTGSDVKIRTYDEDLVEIAAYVIENWEVVDPTRQSGNGIDTVLINDASTEVMQWKAATAPSTGDLPLVDIETTSDAAQFLIGRKSTNWLLAGVGEGDADRWEMKESANSDGSVFTDGPSLVLPSDQSTSGSFLPEVMNLYSGEDAYWYAYYIDSDGYLTVIKFQYGEQSGICPETP